MFIGKVKALSTLSDNCEISKVCEFNSFSSDAAVSGPPDVKAVVLLIDLSPMIVTKTPVPGVFPVVVVMDPVPSDPIVTV